MQAGTLVHADSGRVIAARLRWARTSYERRHGLLGAPQLASDEGLVIERAPQVHTFGMTYTIDVLFCSRDWRVVHVVRRMRPGRMTRWVIRARYAIELCEGAAADVRRGDRLALM